MIRLTYILALIFAITLNATAQSINEKYNKGKNLPTYYKLDNNPLKATMPETTVFDKKSDKAQVVEILNLKFNGLQTFFSLYSRTTPFVYDPVSKILMLTGCERQFNAEGMTQIQGEIYYSKSPFMTWDTLEIFNENETGVVNPSIVVNNHNNAQNMASLPLTLIGRFTAKYLDWGWLGMTYTFKNSNQSTIEIDEYPQENNTNDTYTWPAMKYKSTGTGKEGYAAGTLYTDNPATVQYGAYGFFASLNEPDDMQRLQSKLPDEWSVDIFRPSTNGFGSSFNAPMEISVDKLGNVYVAVNNMFAIDENNRVPAVSKSTDKGETWSEFNRMPVALLDEYKNSQTTSDKEIFPYSPYSQEYGFVAIDNNVYSYFFPVQIGVTNGQEFDIEEIHLIEARYSGGAWSIYKIRELEGGIPFTFTHSDKYTGDDVPEANRRWDVLNADAADLGYEIQASLSTDGYVIVKFIDQTLTEVFPEPILVTQGYGDDEVDKNLQEIGIYDVFIASRLVSGSSWFVKNVTEDSNNYCATRIPDVIPDKDNIPLVSAFPGQYMNPPWNAFNALPNSMRDRMIEIGFAYGFSNIKGAVGVEENPENYNFNVCEVYPNPVSGMAEFAFQLDKSAQVKIELYNSLGQLVKVVYNDFVDAGLHGINADLSEFNSGSYYYTLTAGDNKTTKLLNILK